MRKGTISCSSRHNFMAIIGTHILSHSTSDSTQLSGHLEDGRIGHSDPQWLHVEKVVREVCNKGKQTWRERKWQEEVWRRVGEAEGGRKEKWVGGRGEKLTHHPTGVSPLLTLVWSFNISRSKSISTATCTPIGFNVIIQLPPHYINFQFHPNLSTEEYVPNAHSGHFEEILCFW